MPLQIHFLERATADGGVCIGELVIDDFVERFEAPLEFWTIAEYEQQWSDGLKRLAAGAPKSCLITGMHDPQTANFIVWWPLYRDSGKIFIQNQILFMARLAEPFDPADPYRHLGERVSVTDEGDPVSEWTLNPNALTLTD